MSTNDLQALFANIKPRSRDPSTHPLTTVAPPPASVNPGPISNGGGQAPSASIGEESSSSASSQKPPVNNAAKSLLNLLNFGPSTASTAAPAADAAPAQPQPQQSASATPSNPNPDADPKPSSLRTVSASDLVAKLVNNSNAAAPVAAQPAAPSPSAGDGDEGDVGEARSRASADTPQDALLKLLSKSKSNSASRAASTELSRPRSNPLSGIDSPKASPSSPAPPATAKMNLPPKPDFTYTHPVEPSLSSQQQNQPKASSPQPETPRSPIFKSFNSDTPLRSIETADVDSRAWSPVDQPANARRKLTPRSAFARAERLTRENSQKSPSAPDRVSAGEPSAVLGPGDSSSLQARKEESPAKDLQAGEDEAAAATPTRGKAPLQVGKEAVGSAKSLSDSTSLVRPSAEDAPPAVLSQGDAKTQQQEDPVNQNLQSAADEWEDAEDESPQEEEEEEHRVPVFNFPIKPFVSISLRFANPSDVNLRPEGVMEISRFKKEFDQLDRSLAAATSKYIAYALTKTGGIRVIRQDDGNDHQVFKNYHDRIFNVTFCTTSSNLPPSEPQALLGTGVSGTVYYATLSQEGNDLFQNDELDNETLVFPPWPPADESGPSAVLKTRVRRSSRHPEYFAIGRGKSIHLIWPATVQEPQFGVTDGRREVDMDKLYQERNVQVAIGKAGKDFVFSDDDSVIASLDKAGRLRFWDVRELTEEPSSATATRVKIDVPLLSLLTASPSEKSWPTSVLFVDKIRPYNKGGALRYVLVGLRQNHTLQLWDLALGKAVQELNFPHENEADGICSVSYHPNSCIIVVGHPTRNSIFFIHLSAPRHTLSSSLSQASYIQRIAAKDPELPRPDSTACMSGITELSFASKGQLRSVELLPVHRAADAPKSPTDNKTPQFELYVAHSRGVTCLTITKEDLGWDSGSKVIHPVDALAEGIVEIKDLQQATVIEEPAPNRSPPGGAEPAAPPPPATNATANSSSSSKKKKAKKTALASEALDVPQQPEAEPAISKAQTQSPANGPTTATPAQPSACDVGASSKEVKKAKKSPVKTEAVALSAAEPSVEERQLQPQQGGLDQQDAATSAAQSALPTDASSTAFVASTQSDKASLGISGTWLDKETDKIKDAISKEFKREMGSLRANIQQDRVVVDTSASARQEAVLRLVSETLANNVERTLGDIVNAQIQQVVLPAVSNTAVHAIRDELRGHVVKTLHDLLPRELSSQLPATLKSALFNQGFYDGITHKVAKQVEAQIGDTIKQHIVPTFERLSAAAAKQAAGAAASQVQREVARLEEQRQRDSAKIEQLNSVITGMAETLQSMSRVQLAFQEQLLNSTTTTTTTTSANRLTPLPSTPVKAAPPPPPPTKEEIEFNEIADLMEQGKYEEASIRWLHSNQQVELFDKLFVRYTPDYLATDATPLVAFSIVVTVAKSLSSNTGARLEWIMAAFAAVDLTDPEIADLSEHAPALLTSLIQKLESLYMTTAEEDVNNPILKQIPPAAKKAREMRRALSKGGEGVSKLTADSQALYL